MQIGHKADRRSTGGGIIMHGSHYIKSWSKTQALVALSSAESELYAIAKASSETLGLMSTIRDMNKNFNSALFSDASAALGVVQRQGLGKLRHIDCNYLFVQNLNAEKVIGFVKVPGTENPADLCTKGLGGDLISKFTKNVNGIFSDGRPMMCPTISAINVT